MADFVPPSRPAPSGSPRQSGAASHCRQLPNGSCNWRDLNLGRDASTCGCRQFWLNDISLVPGGLLDQAQSGVSSGAWCFCGHHACFHRLQPSPSTFGLDAVEQNLNQSHWTQQGDSDFGLSRPATLEPQPQDNLDLTKLDANNPSGLGLVMASGDHHQFQQLNPLYVPTSSFFSRAADFLPSTQSSPKPQPRSTSDPGNRPRLSPSTTFAKHIASQRHPVAPISVQGLPAAQPHDDAAQSATELATPSNAGTPALRETEEAFNAVRTTLDAFNRDYLAGTTASNPPHMVLHEYGEHEAAIGVQETMGNTRGTETGANDSARPLLSINQTTVDRLMEQITSLRSLLSATPKFGASLLSLHDRVDALETASFAQVPVEELQEKLEFFDGRLLEVESKVEELENLQAALGEEYHRSAKASTNPGDSFGTNGSFSGSEARISESKADQETSQIGYSAAFAQLSRLEQRLINLEATALPSIHAPWEIEVVFLPWGRQLKGIWTTGLETSQSSRLETQETGGPRSSALSQKSGSHTPGDDATSADSEWNNGSQDRLLPRACGPSRGTAGRVYERLKSRGFVRTVLLPGNSARKVQTAIFSAFSDVIETVSRHSRICTEDGKLAQRFLGLRAPFIPLRKVHKSPRLRYLSHAEMITPSLWTAELLNSSIFMQTPTIGHKRLFVTTAASYVQTPNVANGWTWQMLRELPRACEHRERDENGATVAVAEADANEPCWTWDSRLDPPISVHSSFSSGISYHSSLDSRPLSPQHTNGGSTGASGFSDLEEDDVQDGEGIPDDKTEGPRSPITPVSEFPLSRQSQHQRTASLPPIEPEGSLAASMPKRQIASFEQSSPVKNIPKRRRFSRTPDDVELMAMWNLTPRRSREPPSPGGAQSSAPRHAYETRQREAAQASMARGRLTPQAYATPFSNNVVMEDAQGWVGGDTDADSESEQSSEDEDGSADIDINDEAWEGVDEDEPGEELASDEDEDLDGDEKAQ